MSYCQGGRVCSPRPGPVPGPGPRPSPRPRPRPRGDVEGGAGRVELNEFTECILGMDRAVLTVCPPDAAACMVADAREVERVCVCPGNVRTTVAFLPVWRHSSSASGSNPHHAPLPGIVVGRGILTNMCVLMDRVDLMRFLTLPCTGGRETGTAKQKIASASVLCVGFDLPTPDQALPGQGPDM